MTSARAKTLRIGGGPITPVTRALPEEVPVALVYNGTTQAVMMATPSDLEDFAVGFSLSEGIVTTPEQIEDLTIETHAAGIECRMWLSEDRAEALLHRRRAMAGPVGCGLCGIDSLDQVTRPLPRVTADPGLSVSQITGATEALRAAQPLHDETRAAHAAGFIDPRGLRLAREDVGRHNALDKVIGAMAREGIAPATGAIVLTSRVSIELIQKTAMAGCGMLIAVSAPTTRAVATADEAGLTLIALARGEGAEVFTHPDRIPGLRQGTAHVA
ncbi:formate dehydrogenase accessory sulfurtransferase FdhD [Pseudooceanicola sp.]|uniref:formate dehydrogenase accessory sulfurtransferase FdhD n=1 Tax=Pseudooceanicola sp. TaxID=1914328 RepID=UPI0035C665F7